MAGRAPLSRRRSASAGVAEAVAAEFQARTAEQLFTVLGGEAQRRRDEGRSGSLGRKPPCEEWAALSRHLDQAAGPLPAPHRIGCTPCWPPNSDRAAGGPRISRIRRHPSAAASSGQVAGWSRGRQIQYPGAREVLLSDLAQLSRSPGHRRVDPRARHRRLMAELRSRMSENSTITRSRAPARFRGSLATTRISPSPGTWSRPARRCSWASGCTVCRSRIIAEGDQQTRRRRAALLEFLLVGPGRAGQLRRPAPGKLPDHTGRPARDPGLRRGQPAARRPADVHRPAAHPGARGRRRGGWSTACAPKGFHQTDDRG